MNSDDYVAVITGGSSGIVKGCLGVSGLGEEGLSVVAWWAVANCEDYVEVS